MTYFAVLIDNGSGHFQFYRGWDAIFTDLAQAEQLLMKARIFPAAKITSAEECEARQRGWLDREPWDKMFADEDRRRGWSDAN